jgi:hypothetical protein
MVQTVDWADREDMLHSYELIARYVMPRFQDSLTGIEASKADASANLAMLKARREAAVAKAREDYAATKN